MLRQHCNCYNVLHVFIAGIAHVISHNNNIMFNALYLVEAMNMYYAVKYSSQ